MEPNETRTLVRLAQRRPNSFSAAADSVLDALAEAIPGVIALARFDPDEGAHRVIDTRGEDVSRLSCGVILSVRDDSGSELDPDALRAFGARAWLSAPLEASGGRILGVLCAAAAEEEEEEEAYDPSHAAQLGVAARLLGHEWESVELRSEVRRLRRRVDAGPGTDPDTGLPAREAFLELLDREWRLAERGTVESVLVVCRVGGGAMAEGNGAGGAARRLALKTAAEVLEGSARATDRLGRIGEASIGAILVGCRLRDAPAFVARFLESLGRVGEGAGPGIEVACGVQPLGGSPSPEQALGLAEAAAHGPERNGDRGLAAQEALR